MNLSEFMGNTGFYDLAEDEKAKHLAFFHRQVNHVKEFGRSDILSWFDQAGLSPNISRLLKNIKNKAWSKTNKSGLFEIHGKHLQELEKKYPDLKQASREIECAGAVLPKDLYSDVNRKYVRHIADQANWSYEAGAYDACAVMMRRLLEILLIHTFRNKNIDDRIKKPNGHYNELDVIINTATTEVSLGLTQGVIKELKRCKDLGNYGAHDIVYTCRKSDIEPIFLEYRKVIAHLIDYAGFGT